MGQIGTGKKKNRELPLDLGGFLNMLFSITIWDNDHICAMWGPQDS